MKYLADTHILQDNFKQRFHIPTHEISVLKNKKQLYFYSITNHITFLQPHAP